MRQVSAALAESIEAPVRTIRARVSIDWDGDGHGGSGSIDDLTDHVESLSVERTMTTQLPEECRVVEGSAAAKATVGLVKGSRDDERLDAVRYFSRFNFASPLHGRPRSSRAAEVVYEFLTPTGWQSVPRLTGAVMWGLPVSVGSRSANAELVDARDRMRALVTMPCLVADGPDDPWPPHSVGKPGLEATWVAAYALHAAGFCLAPPPLPGCVLYAPLCGSLQPFLQRPSAGTALGATWVAPSVDPSWSARTRFSGDGPYGVCADPTLYPAPGGWLPQIGVTYRMHDSAAPVSLFAADGRSAAQVEMWCRCGSGEYVEIRVQPDRDEAVNDHMAYLKLYLGQVTLTLINGAVTRTVVGPTVVADGGWHLLGCRWDDGAGTATFRWDDAYTPVAVTPTPATATLGSGAGPTKCHLSAGCAAAELHVTVAPTGWLPSTYTSLAELDRLQNRTLMYTLPDTPRSAWDLLVEIVGAEYGLLWVDGDGKPRVWSRARLTQAAALLPQRVVTSQGNILDLAYDDRRSQLRNQISAGWTPPTVSAHRQLWALAEVAGVGPARTWTIDVELDKDIAICTFPMISGSIQWGTSAGPDAAGTSWPIFDSHTNATATGDVSFWVELLAGNVARISVTNDSADWWWFYSTSTSLPELALSASTLTRATTLTALVEDAASVAEYGDAPVQLSSIWWQAPGWVRGMAYAILATFRGEQVVITDLRIPGDPRLEPWDRIAIQDTDGLMLQTDVLVEGDSDSWSHGGLDQSLTVRPAPTPWIMGGPGVGTGIGSIVGECP